jgi:hypothetical protein
MKSSGGLSQIIAGSDSIAPKVDKSEHIYDICYNIEKYILKPSGRKIIF